MLIRIVLAVLLVFFPQLACADLALISVSPCAILKTWDGSGPVAFVNVPGKWQTYNVSPGWVSPDNAYKVVTVTPFTVPQGQQINGMVSYSIDAQCNVAASYSTVPTPPPPPPPTPAQIALQKLGNGIAITSTGTPALNATYAIDPLTQGQIASVAIYIQTNGRFPAALSVLPWPDIPGTMHSFVSPAQFTAFATAVADVVTAIDLGQSPAQAATIP